MSGRARGGYPIEDDMAFQRRSWLVERVSWIVLALIGIAAVLGLLSHGPLSRTTVASSDGKLSVTYERMERREASSRFLVQVAGAEKDGEVTVRFGPAFLDSYEMRAMTPRPTRASGSAEGFEGVFAASPTGEARIHVTGRATRFGLAEFPVEVPGRGSVRVRQFVFP